MGAGPNGLSYAAPGAQKPIQRETDDTLEKEKETEVESSDELIDEGKGLPLPKIKQAVKIKDEQHTVFTDDLGDGPELMMASTPTPLEVYILRNLVDSTGRQRLLARAHQIRQDMRVAARITDRDTARYRNIGEWMRDVLPGLQHRQQEAYDAINFNIVGLAIAVRNAVEETQDLPEDAADRPVSTRPIHLGWQNLGTHPSPGGRLPFTGTKGIVVNYLTVYGPAGSPTTQQPGGAPGNLRTALGKSDQGKMYTMGHLLNRELHGTGQRWENLAVITSAFNAATETNPGPEHVAKHRVLGNNEVLRYEVRVYYQRAGTATHYEDLLPTAWQYRFYSYDRLPGNDDGSQRSAWRLGNPVPLAQSVFRQNVPRTTPIKPQEEQSQAKPWERFGNANPVASPDMEYDTRIVDTPHYSSFDSIQVDIDENGYDEVAAPAWFQAFKDLAVETARMLQDIEIRFLEWEMYASGGSEEYPNIVTDLARSRNALVFPANYLNALEAARDAYGGLTNRSLVDIAALRAEHNNLQDTTLTSAAADQAVTRMRAILNAFDDKFDYQHEE